MLIILIYRFSYKTVTYRRYFIAKLTFGKCHVGTSYINIRRAENFIRVAYQLLVLKAGDINNRPKVCEGKILFQITKCLSSIFCIHYSAMSFICIVQNFIASILLIFSWHINFLILFFIHLIMLPPMQPNV